MLFFTKMHGLGNDYIYINRLNNQNFITDDKLPSLARQLSNRHFGIGADGIILIEQSDIADFKMRIFNQDGSEAQMCGNGIRCFAKYVYDNKFIQNKSFSIETLAGIKSVYLHSNNRNLAEVTVYMGKPILDLQQLKQEKVISENFDRTIYIDNHRFEITPISIGNPHAVIFVDNVDKYNVKKYGELIENNQNFPQKTNVEFVQIIDKRFIKMRVWERGTGETLACGTGACAALVASASKGFTKRYITVGLLGGNLKINWNENDNQIYMTGFATKVFDGQIETI